DAAEDAADVVAEADVEHAVDLVEDDEADVAEVDDVAVEQVHDASGRADDDLRAVPQEFHLGRNFLPAVHGDDADGRVGAEPLELGIDLDAELASGDQDDGLGRQPLGRSLQDGNAERRRLAGAGARLAQYVDTGQGTGDQERLNL